MLIDLRESLKEVSGFEIRGRSKLEVTGIAYDSRKVRAGNIFFALSGTSDDGACHVDEALSRGAVAVVGGNCLRAPEHVSLVRVDDPRRAMARLSGVFYGSPSRDMHVVGITGTNGKTTTAYLLCSIAEAGGVLCGLIGSVQYRLGERVIPAQLTTPQSPDMHSMVWEMARSGCRCAVVEVSSHGLAQGRVEGIDFDVGVFTNLTSDHLDYHGSLEGYREAKLALFRSLRDRAGTYAVINGDDPAATAFLESSRCAKVTYGLGDSNDVRARDIDLREDGSKFLAETPWGTFTAEINLLGAHNIYNALAALTAGLCSVVGVEAVVSGLRAVKIVPGRLEPVECGQPFRVLVDYAHTEDGLRRVIETLRDVFTGRVILVFGCGGDRDRSKRSKMGSVAAELADMAVITSDNPRKEDPREIIEEIVRGFSGDRFEVIPDRKEAIARALSMARGSDSVLLAGKGHELCQEFSDVVIPFSDKQVAEDILRGMGYG